MTWKTDSKVRLSNLINWSKFGNIKHLAEHYQCFVPTGGSRERKSLAGCQGGEEEEGVQVELELEGKGGFQRWRGGTIGEGEQILKMTDTRRRVKLYELNAERQWDDKGTGGIWLSLLDMQFYPRSRVLNICGETEGNISGGAQRGGNKSSTATNSYSTITKKIYITTNTSTE